MNGSLVGADYPFRSSTEAIVREAMTLCASLALVMKEYM